MRKFVVALFSILLLCASVVFVKAQVGGGVYGPPSLPLAGGTMTGPTAFPAGACDSTAPIQIGTTASLYQSAATRIDLCLNGTNRNRWSSLGYQMGSGQLVGWSSATAVGTTNDTTLARISAGVVGAGTAGGSAGTLQANHLSVNKISQSNTGPGASLMKLEVVAGTNAGSCKLIVYAGTSATPVTIVDNVGSGC